jgi:hypothetical protein
VQILATQGGSSARLFARKLLTVNKRLLSKVERRILGGTTRAVSTHNMLRIALLLSLCACTLAAQTGSLTDERIVDLHKGGLSEDELLHRIVSAPAIQFDLTPAWTDYMLKSGISENVIKAMSARESGSAAIGSLSPPAAIAPVRAAPADQSLMPIEIGVYYRDNGGQWRLLSPEPVNWQTGGVVKRVTTLGVIKGDINGRLRKASSPTHLMVPIELYVNCPEGSGITEYQLVRMHEHPNAREFRTVTGGIFHVSGGAKRDELDFESSQMGGRSYLVKLSTLDPGEYGVLPPGGYYGGSNASAQMGRMYTFSVR